MVIEKWQKEEKGLSGRSGGEMVIRIRRAKGQAGSSHISMEEPLACAAVRVRRAETEREKQREEQKRADRQAGRQAGQQKRCGDDGKRIEGIFGRYRWLILEETHCEGRIQVAGRLCARGDDCKIRVLVEAHCELHSLTNSIAVL